MDCENCKNKMPEMVSCYALEELAARQDIANRRSFIINIILIVLLLFGAKKIPELMKSMGKGVKSFKDGMNGVEEPEIKEDKEKKE